MGVIYLQSGPTTSSVNILPADVLVPTSTGKQVFMYFSCVEIPIRTRQSLKFEGMLVKRTLVFLAM